MRKILRGRETSGIRAPLTRRIDNEFVVESVTGLPLRREWASTGISWNLLPPAHLPEHSLAFASSAGALRCLTFPRSCHEPAGKLDAALLQWRCGVVPLGLHLTRRSPSASSGKPANCHRLPHAAGFASQAPAAFHQSLDWNLPSGAKLKPLPESIQQVFQSEGFGIRPSRRGCCHSLPSVWPLLRPPLRLYRFPDKEHDFPVQVNFR